MMIKPENLDFETWSNGPKSRNSNIRHDGILSIGNFMLKINNHFELFQLLGNLLKTNKKFASTVFCFSRFSFINMCFAKETIFLGYGF
jgi:hypothetical protein